MHIYKHSAKSLENIHQLITAVVLGRMMALGGQSYYLFLHPDATGTRVLTIGLKSKPLENLGSLNFYFKNKELLIATFDI